jgi:hypothetical protein
MTAGGLVLLWFVAIDSSRYGRHYCLACLFRTLIVAAVFGVAQLVIRAG